jgi:hypothetical protein
MRRARFIESLHGESRRTRTRIGDQPRYLIRGARTNRLLGSARSIDAAKFDIFILYEQAVLEHDDRALICDGAIPVHEVHLTERGLKLVAIRDRMG